MDKILASFDPLLFLLTFVGAIALHVFCKCQKVEHVSILQSVNVKINQQTAALIMVLDMALTSLLGAVVVYYLTAPTTNPQAITAGLSFTGIISTIRKNPNGT